MNNLYIDDFVEGLEDALQKNADEHPLFTAPNNASLFPTLSSQAKWKYARGEHHLHLHDGQKVYAFHLPTGLSHEEDFAAERKDDVDPSVFTEGATEHGLAQIHRADPGSIYFTLQEGRSNPTFTLKHTRESTWRGTPKKRKAKETIMPNVDHTALVEGVKAAFAPDKTADFSPFEWAAGPGAHALQRAVFAPGEFVHRLGNRGQHNFLGALGAAGVGAGVGAAYHFGKRNLYNTPEENADEDMRGGHPLLRRMAIPALGAGVIGGAQASVFDNPYKLVESGAGMGGKTW